MSDAENIQVAIYLNLTPAQKWEQVILLRETAWKLKAAAVRQKHPEWDDKAILSEVRRIFLYAVS